MIMDSSEAIEILEISPSASKDKIHTRFRELVQEHHPDTGGDKESFETIVEARDVALSQRSDKLVPAEQTIESFTNHISNKSQRRHETEKTVDRIVRTHTSKFRRYKQTAILFGGAITLIMILPGLLGFDSYLVPLSSIGGQVLIAVYIITFAVLYWLIHSASNGIEMLIQEGEEALEDKMRFINLLNEIGLNYENHPTFTREEFEVQIEKWLNEESSNYSPFLTKHLYVPEVIDFRTLADRIGRADFSRLVVQKGLEKELITEIDDVQDGEWTIAYKINHPKNQD